MRTSYTQFILLCRFDSNNKIILYSASSEPYVTVTVNTTRSSSRINTCAYSVQSYKAHSFSYYVCVRVCALLLCCHHHSPYSVEALLSCKILIYVLYAIFHINNVNVAYRTERIFVACFSKHQPPSDTTTGYEYVMCVIL